ncbi:hypothetical protein [Methylosinus sp. PW1]|uniref:hypothetical protein n=1 Tax=Methylosinus sp. PW1 TaxID=107636 RepID=UPI000B127563|nr:hypothetical protein [Methylosinus sp. PW1]
MAIIDHNVSMPRSIFEAKNLISNPHILAIFITGDIDYFKRIKQPELLWHIRQALRPGVTYIEAIWTPDFFKGWTITPHFPDKTPGLLGGASNAIKIFEGNLQVGITLPMALFPAAPNPRGRPGIADVETQISDAIDAEVYFLMRYLKAFYLDPKLGFVSAEKSATATLMRHIEPIRTLFYVDRSKIDKDLLDKEDLALANLDKIVCDMHERGSKAAATLWEADRRDMEARRLSQLGANIAKARQRAVPEDAADYRTRLGQLDLLVKFRLAAHTVANAQRSTRREIGTKTPPTFKEAFGTLRLPKADSDRMANPELDDISVRPTHAEIVRLARHSAVLLTTLWGSLQYLSPLAEAARAIGEFERRGRRPASDRGAAEIIAQYGLRAIAHRFNDVDDPALSACLELLPSKIVSELAPADDQILPQIPRLLTPGSTHDPG